MSAIKVCERIAKEHNLPEALVRKLVMGMLTEIEAIALETGRCQIRGFGTFKLKTYAGRRMHDYATRQIITIPQRTKLVFEHGRDRLSLVDQGDCAKPSDEESKKGADHTPKNSSQLFRKIVDNSAFLGDRD